MAAHEPWAESLFGADLRMDNGEVTVVREESLASERMDALVREAVFGRGQRRDHARWLIWEIAQAVGVRPSSIHDLYMARGRGECGGFTVPAMNIRGMSYDTARSVFRTANRTNTGAFILEIARSEIAYTEQRPAEYVAVMLAAALREGFRGPVFIQGDHFQVNAKKFATDPTGEVAAVKQLANEAIHAGFYNIDVDTSTLVDLSFTNLDEQQRKNYEVAVDITRYIREREPQGVTVSIGGEIGEVGAQNSTVEELRAFMNGFNSTLQDRGGHAVAGLSKISVQSGTSHGGVVLADGTIADVKLDFQTLAELSRVAVDEYGLAGAVQHGASTLPASAFGNFPETETCEIHLATNFQNMLYDALPDELRQEIYAWLDKNSADERKAKDSDEQFYYKTRKKSLGPFKQKLWDLPDETKAKLASAYDEMFGFLFDTLRVSGTAPLVKQHIRVLPQHRRSPAEGVAVAAAPDDPDAGE
ncbi:MAG TPA: class II fructose-bisphosphate aldolase [Gemmatimonadaceae bacterium]|nr:class II fructose-bisphosphate aldolase [Gemmatimonadaceae bacterium]